MIIIIIMSSVMIKNNQSFNNMITMMLSFTGASNSLQLLKCTRFAKETLPGVGPNSFLAQEFTHLK